MDVKDIVITGNVSRDPDPEFTGNLDGSLLIGIPGPPGPPGNVSFDELTDEQRESLRGSDGYTPVRGKDYWTDADKAEIKDYVDEAILGGVW